jgi:hypothetical protein
MASLSFCWTSSFINLSFNRRRYPAFTYFYCTFSGRVPAFQAGCRGFEPRLPLSCIDRLCASRSQAAWEQPGSDTAGEEAVLFCSKGVQRHPASFFALTHEKSAFVIFTKPLSLEVVSHFAPRSSLCSCSFAQRNGSCYDALTEADYS